MKTTLLRHVCQIPILLLLALACIGCEVMTRVALGAELLPTAARRDPLDVAAISGTSSPRPTNASRALPRERLDCAAIAGASGLRQSAGSAPSSATTAPTTNPPAYAGRSPGVTVSPPRYQWQQICGRRGCEWQLVPLP